MSERARKVVAFIERYQDDEMPLDVVCVVCGAPVGVYCDPHPERPGYHAVRGLAFGVPITPLSSGG